MINEFKKFAFLTNTRVAGKGRREGVGSETKGRWKPRGAGGGLIMKWEVLVKRHRVWRDTERTHTGAGEGS